MKRKDRDLLSQSENHDVVEQLDACADMLYILAGTINELGFKRVIEEVLIGFIKTT
jgi:predicted HAD superfamily Cof-like phosphohydrolase